MHLIYKWRKQKWRLFLYQKVSSGSAFGYLRASEPHVATTGQRAGQRAGISGYGGGWLPAKESHLAGDTRRPLTRRPGTESRLKRERSADQMFMPWVKL